MPGTLFVVATPIGNLEDLTFRALRTLREVDLIAAEDTRRTARLLAHYEIRRPMTSYREHNEARETARLLARLDQGASVALVTDAGTPGIADPGARLVRAAREAGHQVVPIPGASAIATALSISGVDFDEFVFLGFPPAAGSARVAWFERLGRETRLAAFFEAPHRIGRTLTDARRARPNAQLLVSRELTKINETFVVLTNSTNPEMVLGRGEFVVLVEPGDLVPAEHIENVDLAVRIAGALETAGFTKDQVLDLTAKALGVDNRTLKKTLKDHRMYGK